jgi:hypothetical protein
VLSLSPLVVTIVQLLTNTNHRSLSFRAHPCTLTAVNTALSIYSCTTQGSEHRLRLLHANIHNRLRHVTTDGYKGRTHVGRTCPTEYQLMRRTTFDEFSRLRAKLNVLLLRSLWCRRRRCRVNDVTSDVKDANDES